MVELLSAVLTLLELGYFKSQFTSFTHFGSLDFVVGLGADIDK